MTNIAWSLSVSGLRRIEAAKSSFGHLVPHVVERCAEKQMFKTNACWIVAGVAHIHPIGDWTVSFNPCETVRPNEFALIPSNAIAVSGFGLWPDDAFHADIIPGGSQ